MPKIRSTIPSSFMGIDPGKTGGIAVVSDQGNLLHYCEMPPTDFDLLRQLRSIHNEHLISHCFLEQVNTRPGEGHKGAFTFGMNYGKLQMALAAVQISYELIHPRRWQSFLRIKSKEKKETRPIFKERLRLNAMQLFPTAMLWNSGTLKLQRSVCDAMLIAEACRREQCGLCQQSSVRKHGMNTNLNG